MGQIGSCIYNLMILGEKMFLWITCTALICCMITTITLVLGLGIGLGYNYCFNDMQTRYRYVPAHYIYPGSPRWPYPNPEGKEGLGPKPPALVTMGPTRSPPTTTTKPTEVTTTTTAITTPAERDVTSTAQETQGTETTNTKADVITTTRGTETTNTKADIITTNTNADITTTTTRPTSDTSTIASEKQNQNTVDARAGMLNTWRVQPTTFNYDYDAPLMPLYVVDDDVDLRSQPSAPEIFIETTKDYNFLLRNIMRNKTIAVVTHSTSVRTTVTPVENAPLKMAIPLNDLEMKSLLAKLKASAKNYSMQLATSRYT